MGKIHYLSRRASGQTVRAPYPMHNANTFPQEVYVPPTGAEEELSTIKVDLYLNMDAGFRDHGTDNARIWHIMCH